MPAIQCCREAFQSTLPVWGATQTVDSCFPVGWISIHAPRVGSDSRVLWQQQLAINISIHAPRVGSDLRKSPVAIILPEFQSTLPVWGATAGSGSTLRAALISIHAPRVGSDHCHRFLGGMDF